MLHVPGAMRVLSCAVESPTHAARNWLGPDSYAAIAASNALTSALSPQSQLHLRPSLDALETYHLRHISHRPAHC